jgi:hypothetical protein
MGKLTINGPFSIAMLVYQRVLNHPFWGFDFFGHAQHGRSDWCLEKICQKAKRDVNQNGL